MFVFDKTLCSKHKQKKTILSSVWKHVEMIQNIQKYSSVTLKILLTAKENRSANALSQHGHFTVFVDWN